MKTVIGRISGARTRARLRELSERVDALESSEACAVRFNHLAERVYNLENPPPPVLKVKRVDPHPAQARRESPVESP